MKAKGEKHDVNNAENENDQSEIESEYMTTRVKLSNGQHWYTVNQTQTRRDGKETDDAEEEQLRHGSHGCEARLNMIKILSVTIATGNGKTEAELGVPVR